MSRGVFFPNLGSHWATWSLHGCRPEHVGSGVRFLYCRGTSRNTIPSFDFLDRENLAVWPRLLILGSIDVEMVILVARAEVFLDFKPPTVQVAEPPSKKPKADASTGGKGSGDNDFGSDYDGDFFSERQR